MQPTQLLNDATTLAGLQTQSLGDIGRQQTLQTLSGSLSTAGQLIQKFQATLATGQQGIMTYYTAQQDHLYLIQGVGDQDMETTWVWQCQAITALGGNLPANCAGSQ